MPRPEEYPRITIITPSYNQGQFIEETILSIIGQDYPNLEYFVIDGGSTDNTVEVIKKYEDRITWWVSEKDAGQSDAINKGFRRATGDIINWINSDDRLAPATLAFLAATFQSNPELMMVHGRINYFGTTTPFSSDNFPAHELYTRHVAHICAAQPATFYRKKLLDEQGLLDASLQFCMDTDLFVRAGLHYQILQVDRVLADFRLHSGSKSVSSFNKHLLTENVIILNRVLATIGATAEREELRDLGLFAEYGHLYNATAQKFDARMIIYYFIEQRLLTLYFHGQRNQYRFFFRYLLRRYPDLVLRSKKLLAGRASLFLPKGLLHRIRKLGK